MAKKQLKAIELFAGIGGFRLACDSKGIKTVFANDIKPTACKVYMDAFGAGELRIGDISDYLGEIPPHDLLTAGFPCQPFSSAGKKNGIRDPRGTLFEKIVEVLTVTRPRYFVLENVKRLLSMENGEHFATIIDKLSSLGYAIEWRLLNAMNHGLSQNRQRIFITGVQANGNPSGQVRLLSKSEIGFLPRGASSLLSDFANWPKITDHGKSFPTWGVAHDGHFCGVTIPSFSDAMPVIKLQTILESEVAAEFDFTESTLSRLGQNTVIEKFVQGVEILSNQAGGARMGYTIFGTKGVAPTLTASTSRHYERYKIGDSYRRLTNVEYARIQGFPDNHCKVASIYNQYELIGNAVPPQMVEWVLDRLFDEGIPFAQILTTDRQREIFEYAV
ncbi:DNA (cytosine-5-)-methyltransferase [Massilia sp. DJPM01]|uniref:DNA cytosine methyltransferase n=1 Tax=Massilia sp. DJPM01 TaxID=3024404 RepID=UPI00259F4373|nr:DNA (cytosine-5-)-methyltransferase [Massilia sp. DJPM01]MDM5179265.1 DNA (cytosine-5-)-methyltransferase [Massilia sp. DJPM01]